MARGADTQSDRSIKKSVNKRPEVSHVKKFRERQKIRAKGVPELTGTRAGGFVNPLSERNRNAEIMRSSFFVCLQNCVHFKIHKTLLQSVIKAV
jgi:hypothetical protein